ncbi:UBXN6 protein, partial [Mionectes macconnelli]|nr:UBXN6 protein [Mionectes macconnelli]
MKKIFQEIKADLKFKTFFFGQKNSEPSRAPRDFFFAEKNPKPRQAPTDEAQMAAAAALARLELKPKGKAPSCSQESIKNQVRRELMAEAAAIFFLLKKKEKVREEQEEGAAAPSVSGVYFICPLTGAVVIFFLKKKNLREAIQAHFSVDPFFFSIKKIHTFNKDREKVRVGVETMAKYLDNIFFFSEKKKYRKIKLQNKVKLHLNPVLSFQERISCLEGVFFFFKKMGFETKTLPVPGHFFFGQKNDEQFYVLKEEVLARLEELKEHKEFFFCSKKLRARLDRQLHVFLFFFAKKRFELPDDFYNLSADEIRREQRLRTEAVEKASMLRTRAMREKEEQREMRKYNYTLLRFFFPEKNILQGTFYAREAVSVLYSFVFFLLKKNWLPFELLGPGGLFFFDEKKAFNECGLVPSALLSLSWFFFFIKKIEAAGEEQPRSPLFFLLKKRVQTLP